MATREDALSRSIDIAGGVRALARTLGISPQAISQWSRVPAERVLAIERATGGAVTRTELRPDLYPLEEGEQSGEISDLGRRLIKIRERIVASGAPLLDWGDIEREVRERRGGGQRYET